jgi:hypothetical protein
MDGFSCDLVFEYFAKNLSRKLKFHQSPTRITGTSDEHLRKFIIISG